MMETKKMTKREVCEYIIANYENDNVLVDYAKHEIEVLDKKNATRTETKTQKENAKIMENIVAIIRTLDEPISIKDFADRFPEIAISNQKMTALFTKLVNENVIKRNDDKKVKTYEIV